jgi:hypothetical protein
MAASHGDLALIDTLLAKGADINVMADGVPPATLLRSTHPLRLSTHSLPAASRHGACVCGSAWLANTATSLPNHRTSAATVFTAAWHAVAPLLSTRTRTPTLPFAAPLNVMHGRCTQGLTPLFVAALKERPAAAKRLMEKGANVKVKCDVRALPSQRHSSCHPTPRSDHLHTTFFSRPPVPFGMHLLSSPIPHPHSPP